MESPKLRILKTAARLFYQHGYHTTGINQIIEEAQVAKASFYQHYSSKQALGLAYVKFMHEQWTEHMNEAISHKKDPTEKIMALFISLEKWAMSEDFFGDEFLNFSAEFRNTTGYLQEAIVRQKVELRELIYGLLEQACPKMSIAEIEDLNNTIYLLYEGAVADAQLYRDVWPVRAARKAVRNMLEGVATF